MTRLSNTIKKHWNTLAIGTTWLLFIGIGYSLLQRYETSGVSSVPIERKWPADSSLSLSPNCPTLIMLAHPQCPCTRASVNELSQLMTRCPTRLKAYVLFLKPIGTEANWEKTDLWSSASKIPGVSVVADAGGIEAAHFSARTSGQTLLYDSNGNLLFNGGITQSRGHVGDNIGLDAIQAAAVQNTAQLKIGKTFGCSLIDDPSMKSERVLPWQ
jgi:hypothetical protein